MCWALSSSVNDVSLVCFADHIAKQTVKDNILFGKDMDRSWYKEVIKA